MTKQQQSSVTIAASASSAPAEEEAQVGAGHGGHSSSSSSSSTTTSDDEHPPDDKNVNAIIEQKPATPFVTMSDVLQSLNKSLRGLDDGRGQRRRTKNRSRPTTRQVDYDDNDDFCGQQEEDVKSVASSNSNSNSNSSGDEGGGTPRFELQKRFPDGTTRRATDSELAGADMQTKLEQAATYVESSLPSLSAKLEWAEQQRLVGNTLYQQQQFEAAIDVYLTCLVVVARDYHYDNNNNNKEVGNDVDGTLADSDRETQRQRRLLLCFCYVMNNLAQCAMRLSWYKKAQEFCTLGLTRILLLQEEEKKTTTDSRTSSASSIEIQHQVAKLYYKRGKAHRLKVEYRRANADLQQALQHLNGIDVTGTILINNNNKDNVKKNHIEEENTNKEEQQQRHVVVVESGRLQTIEHEIKLVQKAQIEEQHTLR